MKCKLLVIGGSAGSLAFVLKLVPFLKTIFDVGVIIVFHRKLADNSPLIEIISSRTSYKVVEAEDKDAVEPGTIYLAPPDFHLLIERDKTITLDVSERVNYSRPSIDVTFASAADIYGEALICVLLSGANIDGVAGLAEAKAAGALVVVQDPETAEVPYMPTQALEKVEVDLLLTEENLHHLFQIIEFGR